MPHAVAATLEGSVRVAGADTRDRTVAELSEHVAMVFQDPDAQVVTGTLLDEVAFGPENRLVPAAEVLERYLATVPMRRFGGIEDVAHAVSFFASDAAGFVTGQRLVVDGGRGLG